MKKLIVDLDGTLTQANTSEFASMSLEGRC